MDTTSDTTYRIAATVQYTFRKFSILSAVEGASVSIMLMAKEKNPVKGVRQKRLIPMALLTLTLIQGAACSLI